MPQRPTPFDDLDRLFARLNRRVGDVDLGGAHAPLDLVDEGDAVVLTVELPGFESSDVDVTLDDRTLTVDAERSAVDDRADEGEYEYLRRERRASVRRSVRLPEAVDESDASASYDGGVLTVTLPKVGVADAHRIDVE